MIIMYNVPMTPRIQYSPFTNRVSLSIYLSFMIMYSVCVYTYIYFIHIRVYYILYMYIL